MKYISIGILLFAMSWSWSLIHRDSKVSESVHIGIQDDLKRIISEYIEKNLPSSKDLRFEKIWTEKVKDDQVKASFIYSFEDENEEVGAARVEIEGYALLNRDKTPNEEFDVWSFDELYILNNRVDFKEGITVGPNAENAN